MNDKASAAALAVKASNVIGVVAEVSADGTYHRAQSFAVHIPTERTEENAHIYEDAVRMAQPTRAVNLNQPKDVIPAGKTKKPGRNDPCPVRQWCKIQEGAMVVRNEPLLLTEFELEHPATLISLSYLKCRYHQCVVPRIRKTDTHVRSWRKEDPPLCMLFYARPLPSFEGPLHHPGSGRRSQLPVRDGKRQFNEGDKQTGTAAKNRRRNYATVAVASLHSHSIVPGGLLVTS